ncbi:unnamed protein product [Acanthosepion pharaonis]|uniref:Uncharacterized protein n=1 Tax=Acanthosepion pharaonis TaxID=158019 RepID=A0A812EFD5_ACAPH|nr:unnamed protein product [Sepia pharaonis]
MQKCKDLREIGRWVLSYEKVFYFFSFPLIICIYYSELFFTSSKSFQTVFHSCSLSNIFITKFFLSLKCFLLFLLLFFILYPLKNFCFSFFLPYYLLTKFVTSFSSFSFFLSSFSPFLLLLPLSFISSFSCFPPTFLTFPSFCLSFFTNHCSILLSLPISFFFISHFFLLKSTLASIYTFFSFSLIKNSHPLSIHS